MAMRAPRYAKPTHGLSGRCLALAITVPSIFGMLPSAEVQANPDCIDATNCTQPFDEANAGDNQSGDSGSEREPPTGGQN
jgi:hypothetical protein